MLCQIEGAQCRHVPDARPQKPLAHCPGNPRQIVQRQMGYRVRHVAGPEPAKPVWLLQLARDLGKQVVRPDPGRKAQAGADLCRDRRLEPCDELGRTVQRGCLARQHNLKLVHGPDTFQFGMAVNDIGDPQVEADVEPVARGQEHDVGAQVAGVPHRSPCFDAERLGLVARGHAGPVIPLHRSDRDRTAAQPRVELLFDRGEERVHVNV